MNRYIHVILPNDLNVGDAFTLEWTNYQRESGYETDDVVLLKPFPSKKFYVKAESPREALDYLVDQGYLQQTSIEDGWMDAPTKELPEGATVV